MHKKTHRSIKKKEWSKEEIDKAISIIRKDSHKKHPGSKIIDRFIDYTIIFSGIALSVGLSFLFFPLLLVTKTLTFISIMVPVSIIIGLLYGKLTKDLFIFEKERHEISAFISPLVGCISMWYVTAQANSLGKLLFADYLVHPTIAISLIYTASFLLPLIILTLADREL